MRLSILLEILLLAHQTLQLTLYCILRPSLPVPGQHALELRSTSIQVTITKFELLQIYPELHGCFDTLVDSVASCSTLQLKSKGNGRTGGQSGASIGRVDSVVE